MFNGRLEVDAPSLATPGDRVFVADEDIDSALGDGDFIAAIARDAAANYRDASEAATALYDNLAIARRVRATGEPWWVAEAGFRAPSPKRTGATASKRAP
jgi:hypothetical protein